MMAVLALVLSVVVITAAMLVVVVTSRGCIVSVIPATVVGVTSAMSASRRLLWMPTMVTSASIRLVLVPTMLLKSVVVARTRSFLLAVSPVELAPELVVCGAASTNRRLRSQNLCCRGRPSLKQQLS